MSLSQVRAFADFARALALFFIAANSQNLMSKGGYEYAKQSKNY